MCTNVIYDEISLPLLEISTESNLAYELQRHLSPPIITDKNVAYAVVPPLHNTSVPDDDYEIMNPLCV